MSEKRKSIMKEKNKSVAFDLGGVLMYQDHSTLTEEEQLLFKVYMNRNNQEKIKEYYQLFGEEKTKKILAYAEEQIQSIYIKIHRLSNNTIETLETLKRREITPSIWTNNIRAIDMVLERFGFYDYVKKEHIINSFDFGYDKPNRNFYRYALEKTKQVPKEVLFIDDSLKNVEGAKVLDIHALEYIESEKKSLKEATLEEIEKIEKKR